MHPRDGLVCRGGGQHHNERMAIAPPSESKPISPIRGSIVAVCGNACRVVLGCGAGAACCSVGGAGSGVCAAAIRCGSVSVAALATTSRDDVTFNSGKRNPVRSGRSRPTETGPRDALTRTNSLPSRGRRRCWLRCWLRCLRKCDRRHQHERHSAGGNRASNMLSSLAGDRSARAEPMPLRNCAARSRCEWVAHLLNNDTLTSQHWDGVTCSRVNALIRRARYGSCSTT
jgi:hypothetical protein